MSWNVVVNGLGQGAHDLPGWPRKTLDLEIVGARRETAVLEAPPA